MATRRGGGRAARRELRSAAPPPSAPFMERKMPPVEILDEEALVQIEENAETILSEIGIAFQDFPEALDLWRAAGAEVEGELVKFPKGLCRQLVQESAPSIYT